MTVPPKLYSASTTVSEGWVSHRMKAHVAKICARKTINEEDASEANGGLRATDDGVSFRIVARGLVDTII